jgi:HK97 family phage major capsid protein
MSDKIIEKEVEITDDLQKDITKNVLEDEGFKKALSDVAADAATKAADAVFAKFDLANKKDIEPTEDEKKAALEKDKLNKNSDITDAVEKQLVKRYFGETNEHLVKEFPLLTKSPLALMSKERRFYNAIKAVLSKDQEAVKAYNAFSGEMYALKAYQDSKYEDLAQKAGYANDAVSADGGALVPDPEFNTTVYENLPKYGVIFADGNVMNTDRTAVYALSLTGTIVFTNVAEAGAISGTKLAFGRKQTNLIKYAAIIPATTELTEDSIVDYWALVTNEIARAYGLVADTQVFTDTTNGLLHSSGIITHPLISGGAGTTIAWDDLLAAEGAMEDMLDTSDFVWYLRKETYFRLAQLKASTSGVYLSTNLLAGWAPNPNNPSTPWGTPVHFTRILPRSVDVSANGGLAVYGSLKNTNFYNRNGMEITMLTEATITDASSNSLNLATQDAIAMRAVVRLLHILPTGNASKFVVVGTGTVS